MQAALIFLIISSLVMLWCNYCKARRLFTESNQDVERTWHAKPLHFGFYGAGKTLLLALFLLLAWWIFQDTIAESYASYRTDLVSEERQAFYIYESKKAIEKDALHTLTESQKIWAAHYKKFSHVSTIIVLFTVGLLAIHGALTSYYSIHSEFYARKHVEKWIKWWLFAAAAFSILITFLILLSVLYEAVMFFSQVPLADFLFGLKWSPQTAIRADQAGSSGAFGVVPLFLGTLLITIIAICVAVPIGLFSAIYMTQYANSRLRNIVKPMLEILAGIPTIVYGFFAVTVMAPFMVDAGKTLQFDMASDSALVAGLVMGIMIVPLISSLADDAISSVPRALRDASLGLGATKSETIKQVILPAALPGIMGGVLLAVSRAIGETMIVVMAAGLAGNLTVNPFESVTTITVQIVALLGGDQEFASSKTLAAFALGLTLFIFTLILNIIALHLVKRYREAYE